MKTRRLLIYAKKDFEQTKKVQKSLYLLCVSKIKEIGKSIYDNLNEHLTICRGNMRISYSILEAHFRWNVKRSKTFESMDKAIVIKKMIFLHQVKGIIFTKLWKYNQSPIGSIKRSSFFYFCSMFSCANRIKFCPTYQKK